MSTLSGKIIEKSLDIWIPIIYNMGIQKKGGQNVSPKTGRPPIGGSSKDRGYRVRMSDEELSRLEFCSKVLQIPKSEVIRRGLDKMYEEAKKQK